MTNENIEFIEKRIQPLLQAEAAECGLACLGMMFEYHGDTDIVSLRQKFSLSIKGCTMADILSMAEHVGIIRTRVRLSWMSFPNYKPLHPSLGNGTFVVLEKVGKDKLLFLILPAGESQ